MGALRAAARGRGTKLRRRSFLPCVRRATRGGFRPQEGKCACQSARRRIILADKGAGRASGGILTSKRIGHGPPVRLVSHRVVSNDNHAAPLTAIWGKR